MRLPAAGRIILRSIPGDRRPLHPADSGGGGIPCPSARRALLALALLAITLAAAASLRPHAAAQTVNTLSVEITHVPADARMWYDDFITQFTLGGQSRVPRANDLIISGTAATVSSGASHSFSGLTASTEYTLYVRTKNSGGTSDWSSPTATTMALPTPGGLRITRQGGVILELAWDRVAGATGYEVKRVTGTAEVREPNAGCCSIRFLDATADTAYTFTVRARNSSGLSSWSAALSVTTGPPAPTGLSAAATSSSLTLSWSAVTGATSYEVKQTASGTVTAVSSGVSHTFSGLTANAAYDLYVRAKNSNGTSPWSLISATTSPAAPTSLSVAKTSASLTLSWSAVTGATSYEVRRGASGTVTAVSSGTSHTFSSLVELSRYTLYVRAKNGGETSPWAFISATTNRSPLTGLSVTPGINSLTLTWNPAAAYTGSTPTGYQVKQGANGAVTTLVGLSRTSFTVSGLTPGVEYTIYMRVAGVAADWASINGTPWVPLLSSPSLGLSLSAGPSIDSMTLNWNSVAGAAGYEVKRGASGAVTEVAATKTSLTFTDLNLTTDYTFYLRVKHSSGAVSAWTSISGIPFLVALIIT